MTVLTQARLQTLLHYNPTTGMFRRLSSRGNRKAGCEAAISGKNYYRRIAVDGREYGAHRLAWLYVYGYMPDGQIDHINRDKQDNRIENLRIATPAQNLANSERRRSNSSGFKGVTRSRRKCKKSWIASITVAGRHLYLGSFLTPEEASLAYAKASVAAHSQFAYHDGGKE
jgi:hypothetical protein